VADDMSLDALDIDDEAAESEPEPRERYHVDDIASDHELAVEERQVPRSDDDDAWEHLCAPIVAFMSGGPTSLRVIKRWAELQKPRMRTKLAEECVFWLENRGRVVAFKQWDGSKAYRLTGAAASQALEEDNKPKENTVAKDWISTADVMKLLGCKQERASYLAVSGKIVSRKNGEGRSAPREYDRTSVIAYRDHEKKKGDILDEPKKKPAKAPPRREPKAIAAKVARKPAAPISAGSGGLAEDLRMLLRCVDRGWLSQDEAFAKLRGIADAL
jgi:hypothetical protein